MKRISNKILVSLCVALWASALSAQTHFTCDYHQFQYDMTVYFQLTYSNGVTISQTDNYEVAAFVGDECRGVGEFLTSTGTNGQTIRYGYLRVRSNVANGENVTFKYYDKEADEETVVSETTIAFEADKVRGLPSSPLSLVVSSAAVLLGDVNGDGSINAADLSAVINKILLRPNSVFIDAAADMNGDGLINAADLSAIINVILKK